MQLVKWNPWREINRLPHPFNTVWDDFFFSRVDADNIESARRWNPVVDVYENESHFIIKAELPGIDKSHLDLDVKGRVLSLRGERQADKVEETDTARRRERVFGRFERSFTLPTEVDPETIRAEYKDGVLAIEVPKPEKQQPKQITIH